MQPHRSESDIEFDRAAREGGDVRVVNVSPFDARIEIATVPGSPPRMIRLAPGETTLLSRGYTVETRGASKHYMVPAAIEVNTTREAWPGRRSIKEGKETWHTNPGPRLPQVVAESKADAVRAQWDQAMSQRAEAEKAPMRIVMQRTDGTSVEVEAAVEPAPRARAPVDDGGIVPIPDDDPDDMPPLVLPPMQPTAPAPVKPEIKRAGR